MTKEEFSSRVTAMERLLYCIARTILPGPQDCADAMQEAILKAWAALPTLRDPEKLEGFLIRILRNTCYSERKKRRETPVAQLPETAGVPESGALALAMAGLTPEEKQLLLLHHDAGYSLNEIGQSLGIPVSVLKVRLFRARRKLSGLLEEVNTDA